MLHRKIKETIIESQKRNRMPNAICFIDKGGRGSLELASEIGLAIVERSTRKFKSNYTHPDLHYVYPTKIPKDEKRFRKGMNLFYIKKWREFINTHIHGSVDEWLNVSSSDNKIGSIRVNQIKEAISSLNLKPYQSDKKVCIIWGLEYLREESANKLLKIIEEPPSKTHFILIGKNQRKVLPTLISRCQIIELPPLTVEEVQRKMLALGYNKSESLKASIYSKGSLAIAMSKLTEVAFTKERESLFVNCLRACYLSVAKKDFSQIIVKSNEVGALNRSELKQFLLFGIDFIRQSYFYSQGVKKLFDFESLNGFAIERFAPYVNNKNYEKLISLFELNLNYLKRNANQKLLTIGFFFKLSEILYGKN